MQSSSSCLQHAGSTREEILWKEGNMYKEGIRTDAKDPLMHRVVLHTDSTTWPKGTIHTSSYIIAHACGYVYVCIAIHELRA